MEPVPPMTRLAHASPIESVEIPRGGRTSRTQSGRHKEFKQQVVKDRLEDFAEEKERLDDSRQRASAGSAEQEPQMQRHENLKRPSLERQHEEVTQDKDPKEGPQEDTRQQDPKGRREDLEKQQDCNNERHEGLEQPDRTRRHEHLADGQFPGKTRATTSSICTLRRGGGEKGG